jgi:hypothetical protein
MCMSCFKAHVEEVGRTEVTDDMRAVLPLIAAVYEESCVGGNLHIVVDDWNIEDHHVKWCAEIPNLTAAEQACVDALLALTEAQRNEVMLLESAYEESDIKGDEYG